MGIQLLPILAGAALGAGIGAAAGPRDEPLWKRMLVGGSLGGLGGLGAGAAGIGTTTAAPTAVAAAPTAVGTGTTAASTLTPAMAASNLGLTAGTTSANVVGGLGAAIANNPVMAGSLGLGTGAILLPGKPPDGGSGGSAYGSKPAWWEENFSPSSAYYV